MNRTTAVHRSPKRVSHGQGVTTSRFGPVSVTRARYPKGSAVQSHRHDHDSLMWTTSGVVEETVDGKPMTGAPWTVVYKSSDVEHSTATGASDADVIIIELLPEMVERFGAVRTRTDRAAFAARGTPTLLAMELTRALSLGPGVDEASVEEVALEILVGTAVRHPELVGLPTWLLRVRDRLNDDIGCEPRLTALADEAGVHPVYLARSFRKAFGCSISTYIHRRRVDRAIEAILQNPLTLARVGLELGYYDHAHFTKTFRAFTGVTPNMFRACVRAVEGRDRQSRPKR